jgi:3-isopropylmalate/(R)-2-methylmalate dehydratase small subunit
VERDDAVVTDLDAPRRGRVWKFGDDVDTDRLAPYDTMPLPWPERRPSVLRERPELAADCQPGDILVAGRNFGCGSSREPAVDNLGLLGLSCVLATSFARIYFRNAVATGFPNLVCPGIADACDDGDVLEVRIRDATVRNLTRGTAVEAVPLDATMLAILESGGLMALLRQRFGTSRAAGSR